MIAWNTVKEIFEYSDNKEMSYRDVMEDSLCLKRVSSDLPREPAIRMEPVSIRMDGSGCCVRFKIR